MNILPTLQKFLNNILLYKIMKIKREGKLYTRRLILGLIILSFLMQVVFALETEIKVKTMPNHEVQLTTSKANTADFSVIESFKNNSDEYGDITFISYASDPEINIIVYLKKDNVKIMGPERFVNKPTGELIYLEIAPAWFEFINNPANEINDSNQTIENLTTNESIQETEEQPEQEEDKISQTGSVISEEGDSLQNKTIFYFIGIIVLLIGGLVIFGIMRKTRQSRSEGKKRGDTEDAEEIVNEIEEEEGNIEKKKEIIGYAEKKAKVNEKKKKIIDDVEKKMKEVEGEIEELKDKD